MQKMILIKTKWQLCFLLGLISCLGCSEEITPARDHDLGVEWLKREQFTEAVDSFSLALKIDPKHTDSLRMRGVAQQKLGNFSEARADFDEALKIDPKDAKTLAAKAALSLEEDQLMEAISNATEAIEIDPKLGEAYLHRGKAYLELEDYSSSLKDVLESNRNSRGSEETTAKTYALLGQIYFETEDYLEAIYNFGLAINYYDDQVRNAPKHKVTVIGKEEEVWEGKEAYDAGAAAYAGRAAAYLAQGKVDEAYQDAKKAVRLNAKSDEALYQEARALFELGRFYEAKKDLKKAIDINPNRAEFYDLRAWISAACTEEMDRDALMAVQDALRACEMTEHQNADYLETLAAAYAESENFTKAIQWQREAIRLAGGDDATVRRARLQLYEQGQPYRLRVD